MGACLAAAILAVIAWLFLGGTKFLLLAAGCAVMMVPVAGTFHAPKGMVRILLGIYTLALAALGITAFVFSYRNPNIAGALGAFFVLGWVIFSWVGNAAVSRRSAILASFASSMKMSLRSILMVAALPILAATLRAESGDQSVEVGGMERTYRLYVPPAYQKGKPAPLVFVFHGGGGDIDKAERLSSPTHLPTKRTGTTAGAARPSGPSRRTSTTSGLSSR
jgi:hypothetical protein